MLKQYFSLFLLFFALSASAFNPKDSIKIETLLREGKALKNGDNRMLFFGRKFIGTPYVAHTLEVNDQEQLVVNTRQLDCSTFVETVVALTLCSERGETKFHDFCRQLQKLRYSDGNPHYTTRNHYFTGWLLNNEQKGFVKPIESAKKPFTAVQHVNVNYMTKHYTAYKMLNRHKEWLSAITKMEHSISGKNYNYIPRKEIDNSTLLRSTIHDGDVIGIVTKKKGLDTTHLGIAVWKKDGLHLLNASQIRGKVVEEPVLFRNYMQEHPSQLGIRLCRVL